MKYPQLVSMPSAVQDWLDEQLEARGIDAVVYTRYILSLLQKDALDLTDDILTLSSNKGREVGRRGRKRGRRQEYWNVLDCEQLKRSAAVECLMSASDQKCGIEKLVDELCAKLKEIQSEGETAADSDPPETSVSQQVTQSLQDQVQKYYAAFPPLSSKSNEGNKSLNLVTDLSSVWGTKSISANLLCKSKSVTNSGVVNKGLGFSKSSVENKENQGNIEKFWKEVGRGSMKSRVQLKDKSLGNKKGTCYGFAWSMSGEWGRSCSEMSSGEQDESCTSSDWLVSKYNNKNMESTSLTSDEALVMENKDIWNEGVCRRLYQRQTESAEFFNLPQGKEIMGYSDEALKDSTDDTNLAQLIAKFDHSIEALWNPDDAASTDNVFRSKLVKDDQNLAPGELNILSPNKQLFNVEVKNWNNKQNYSYNSCGNNSFIQCGTNITNSIWSDQVTHDNSSEGDEFARDYNVEGSGNLVVLSDTESLDRCFEENKDKYIISSEDDDKDQCNAMLVGDGKIVGHRTNSDNKCGSKKNYSSEKSNTNFKSLGSYNKFSNPITEEKSKVVWSKYESFPSFFSSFPLGGINYSLEEFTKNLSNKKWSDVEDTPDNYANYDIFATYFKKPSNMSILTDSIGNCSLNTLNHNKEDSSFTEVIPKQPQVNSKSALQTEKLDGQSNLKNDFDKDANDLENIDKEEEDLLTSTRTHFRPIRQESLDSHNHAGCYADGTTFVIPNSLESITFKRSESGTLYLETEVGLDTPKKYMEYKEKEPYGGRHKFDGKGSNFVNSNLGNEFIPKFRVHQIEKCCQTEETDEMLLSDEEVDPKRSRHDIKSDSDFYFPGDELFAEKIINCLEDNDVSDCGTSLGNNNECKNVIKCTTFNTVHMTPQSNSISLENTVDNPESSQQNWCKCSGNNNETPWKFAWPKSSGENTSVCVWNSSDSKPNHLSQSWYDIWSGGPGATTTCQKCCSVMNAGHSLQYRKLREELSQDGEQLLSDLSYLQHLYLGSDCWSDDSAPPPSVDWEQMQGGLNTQNLQCLSPTADSCHDVQLYDDSGFMSKSPSQLEQSLCGPDLNVQNKPLEELVSTSSPKTFPLKIMLSMELERERDINERPFSAKLVPKDRKRRHSGSQRPGSGQQPDAGCRLPGELPTITCHIWATDPPCLKGTRNRSLRPVTL